MSLRKNNNKTNPASKEQANKEQEQFCLLVIEQQLWWRFNPRLTMSSGRYSKYQSTTTTRSGSSVSRRSTPSYLLGGPPPGSNNGPLPGDPRGPLSSKLRTCATALLWAGASAGASYSFYSFYRLHLRQQQLHHSRSQNRRQRRRRLAQGEESEEEDEDVMTERTGAAEEIWLRFVAVAGDWSEKLWTSLQPKLPLLLWMSTLAVALDSPDSSRTTTFTAWSRRWAVSALLALPWIIWSPPSHENDSGYDNKGRARKHDHNTLWHTPTLPKQQQKPPPHPPIAAIPRYVELLVHNVSHTDLILSLQVDPPPQSSGTPGGGDLGLSFVQVPPDVSEMPAPSPARRTHRRSASSGSARTRSSSRGATAATTTASPDDISDPYCLARPRFSCFEKYSRLVWDQLRPDCDDIVCFDRYARHEASHRIVVPSRSDAPLEPTATGFALANPVPLNDLGEIRVRGRDQDKVIGLAAGSDRGGGVCRIRHVFFPLLATLLPRWKERIQAKKYNDAAGGGTIVVKRVLILVSGVGTPRNWTHDRRGNSTATCARLMKAFLERIDPTLTVVLVHSETNIFRYDENLVFVEHELMPQIHAYRDAHARGLPYPDETNAVPPPTVSLRTHPFAPDWRDTFHTTLSFASGSPARTYAIQASLRQYRPTYFHFWQLKTFWHESKIVNNDIEVHSFEAMETIPPVDIQAVTDRHVAMVIQELLAFKEAMVRTLQSDHDISRFWLRKTHKPVIAVLLVQNDDDDSDDAPALYRGTNMEVSMPTGSLCAERNVIGTALADRPGLKREDLKIIAVLAVPMAPARGSNEDPKMQSPSGMRRVHSCAACIDPTPTTKMSRRKPSVGTEEEDREWILPPTRPDSRPSTPESLCDVPSTSPVRTISLFSKPRASPSGPERTVILGSSHARDLNPLRPCGACNEWLKKIAECNPYFKILTFTDAECNGVYITPCQD